jgi:uncharacterized membrane protein YphA (DoxX/SURF4 family)
MELELTMAHVKWFTHVSPTDLEPIQHVLTAWWWFGFTLALIVLLFSTRLNSTVERFGWVRKAEAWLYGRRGAAIWLMRVGTGVPLIAAGLSGFLFQYELRPIPLPIRIAEVVIGLLCLTPLTDKFGAAGIFLLYLTGIGTFSLFQVLDYVAWVGAATYLLVHRTPYEKAGLPTLYIATGLSLAWAAIEKWVYPSMSLDIIAHWHLPTFGFPPAVFVTLAGWIELGVGYALITGVLNRFWAAVVTGLFILTSSVFGLAEVLGHWILHGALFVFLLEGTGRSVTPVEWHKKPWLRYAFVGVTLVPFVFGLIYFYYLWAH